MSIKVKVRAWEAGKLAGAGLVVAMTPAGADDPALYRALGTPFAGALAALGSMRGGKGPAGAATIWVGGKAGVPANPPRWLVALSAAHHMAMPPAERLKTMAAKAVESARALGATHLSIPLHGPAGPDAVASVAEGLMLGAYKFTRYQTAEGPVPLAATLVVSAAALPAAEAALARAAAVGAALNFARDLVNTAPSDLVPADLADAARAMAEAEGLYCEVLDEPALVEQGYMGTVTVGRGAVHRPVMIVLKYRPDTNANIRAKPVATGTHSGGGGVALSPHLALVGKAVTFDTGGISIKPAKDMCQMKGDMAGGAAVLGAMMAIARLKPDVAVTAVIPSAQNAIGPRAVLPGDIIRAKNGKTVHVDNTDAEGRLILMDALIRAREEGATHCVDAATLTGSVVRALGPHVAGLFGNDDGFQTRVELAAAAAGEPVWRLPMVEEYRDMLKHDTADMDNVAASPNAGAIVAALFLREFVDPAMRWAHLDIAGPALLSGGGWRYFGPGGTGFGLRTFVELAQSLAGPAPTAAPSSARS